MLTVIKQLLVLQQKKNHSWYKFNHIYEDMALQPFLFNQNSQIKLSLLPPCNARDVLSHIGGTKSGLGIHFLGKDSDLFI